MPRNRLMCVAIACGLLSGRAWADVWDTATLNDDGTGTQNELVHGSGQWHDLGARPGSLADEDWFRLGQPPYTSWEVVVDGLSADTISLDRMGPGGTNVLQSSAPVSSLGLARSLRWQNGPLGADGQFLRVKSTGCASACTSSDVYQIRLQETTYAISRFNNAGDQVTSVVVQNVAAHDVGGSIYFWSASGTLLATVPLATPPARLGPKQLLVVNSAAIPVLADASGSITIAHDGRYGDLAGKATSLEPSTGFTFDTPMVPRSR